jgi:acylphosphatase
VLKQLQITISGQVQGVSLRLFVNNAAHELNLTGYVKNNSDGTVTILAQGEKTKLAKLLDKCYAGPDTARIEQIKHEWQLISNSYQTFKIEQ